MVPGVGVRVDQLVELQLDPGVLPNLAVLGEPTAGVVELRCFVLKQAKELEELGRRPWTSVAEKHYGGTLGAEFGGDGQPSANRPQIRRLACEKIEKRLQISGRCAFHEPQQF